MNPLCSDLLMLIGLENRPKRYGGGQTGKADGQENCEKETKFHPLELGNLTKDFTTTLEALRVKKLSRLFLICCFASFKGTSKENTDAI